MIRIVFTTVAVVSLCQSIHAAISGNVTFNVIHNAQNGLNNRRQDNKMGVRFESDSTVFLLNNQHTPNSLIYTGSFASPSSKYQYVIVDHKNKVLDSEPFFRTTSSDSPSTYEFYGRAVTQVPTQHLPAMPLYPEDYHYKVGLDRNQVHPNDEIPTWHLEVPDAQVLHAHVLDDIGITGNMTRISSNKVDQFHNVRLELSGHTSRLFKKLTYSVRLNDNADGFNGYRRFKLRSCATDPSYMREKLYYDILESMNVPAAKASYVRLFINREPQGLYLVVDHYKDPFFKNVFGSGKHGYRTGALVQGSVQENPMASGKKIQEGANLAYWGKHIKDYYENGTVSAYEVQEAAHGGKKEDAMKDLVSFIHFVNEKNQRVRSASEERKRVHEWNKRFDVNLFLKHLSLELLLGHGDGYMGAAHNYMLYQDFEQKGRFVWVPSDLDQTMGNTLKATETQVQANSLVGQFDRFGTFASLNKRPLVESLLQLRPFQQRFQKLLLDIRHSLLHSDNVLNYIRYLKDLIEQDVHWDQQLEPFRMDNFAQNKTLYEAILYDKVVQLPLGKDFIQRIDDHSIDFNTAIEGDIEDHPSITSLFTWFNNLNN